MIVAKKQAQNLRRLINFVENQSGLQKKKVLIVDDEADLASVRFVKKKDDPNPSQGTIAEQIDALRALSDVIAFLQVTATPYSLYLQPETYEDAGNSGNFVFKPKRPAFTEVLPVHSAYVGGDDYYGSFEEDDPSFEADSRGFGARAKMRFEDRTNAALLQTACCEARILPG